MRVLILITTLFLSVYSEWVFAAGSLSENCPYGYRNQQKVIVPLQSVNRCSELASFHQSVGALVSDCYYQTNDLGQNIGAHFYKLAPNDCASQPSDATKEDGCFPGETCADNNRSCYDSSGRSFQISALRNCDDYCKGPVTTPEYDSSGNLIGYQPVDDPRGTASVHRCSGGDDPFSEKLSSDQSEQGYDGEVCGAGQRFNGQSCEAIPDSCGYVEGSYVCADSDGNTLQCGNQSGNQNSDFCKGANEDKDQGNDGSNGSGGNSGGGSDGSGDGTDGNGSGDSGSGNSSGGGTTGGDSVDGSDANDGTGDGIPDGQTEVDNCDGIAKCQCRYNGLAIKQCFAPDPQACKKGYHWDMAFAECMRDDCPEGQFDPGGSPFLNCRPIQCDDGSEPTEAGCPEDQPDVIDDPTPDDDGDPSTPDETPSDDNGDIVNKLGEILDAIQNADANNTSRLNGIGSKLDTANTKLSNVGGGGGAPTDDKDDDEAGDCDPTDKDYLSCIELDSSGNAFSGFNSLEDQIREAKTSYQARADQIIQEYENALTISSPGTASPFFRDVQTVKGVEVDFGTSRLESFLQYLPALILFLAAVYSAFTMLGGYRS